MLRAFSFVFSLVLPIFAVAQATSEGRGFHIKGFLYVDSHPVVQAGNKEDSVADGKDTMSSKQSTLTLYDFSKLKETDDTLSKGKSINGHFELSGRIDNKKAPLLVKLDVLRDDKQIHLQYFFLLENTDIFMTDSGRHAVYSGTPLLEELTVYTKKVHDYNRLIRKLKKEMEPSLPYQKARSKQEVENDLAKTRAEYSSLLMEYALKHKTYDASYLLLSNCIDAFEGHKEISMDSLCRFASYNAPQSAWAKRLCTIIEKKNTPNKSQRHISGKTFIAGKIKIPSCLLFFNLAPHISYVRGLCVIKKIHVTTQHPLQNIGRFLTSFGMTTRLG